MNDRPSYTEVAVAGRRLDDNAIDALVDQVAQQPLGTNHAIQT